VAGALDIDYKAIIVQKGGPERKGERGMFVPLESFQSPGKRGANAECSVGLLSGS